jgi:hypothetical protein
MKSDLAFRTAEKHVRNYEKESQELRAEHREAMDCRDCETFLQLGIDAFSWLIRADRVLRTALAEGVEDAYSKEVADAFHRMCKAWLAPCEYARKWIGIQIERGYTIDNLAQFEECCEEMEAIVEFNDRDATESLPVPIANHRNEAVNEFDNGQTAEFV